MEIKTCFITLLVGDLLTSLKWKSFVVKSLTRSLFSSNKYFNPPPPNESVSLKHTKAHPHMTYEPTIDGSSKGHTLFIHHVFVGLGSFFTICPSVHHGLWFGTNKADFMGGIFNCHASLRIGAYTHWVRRYFLSNQRLLLPLSPSYLLTQPCNQAPF
jgi:hypothetical protein